MSDPALRIEVGFNTTASTAGVFVLGSSLLGGGDRLKNIVWTDVTQWVSGQVSVTRGRSRETDQYQAGTAQFTLRNEDRRFDPSNTSGPYYPGPDLRVPVNISLINGYVIYAGYVEDISVDYEIPNISTTTFTCVDAFSILANMTLRLWNPPAGLTSAAVTSALSQVSYGNGTSISAGSTTIQSTLQDNVTVLDFCQTMARSENGYFYTDSSGVVHFVGRHSRTASLYANFTDSPSGQADIGYTSIKQTTATTLLYNEVAGTRTGGTAQAVSNSTSKAKYLTRSLSLGTLENASDTDVLNLCRYVLGRYATPEIRFDQITIEIAGLNDYASAAATVLELTRTVSVTRTPPGGGSAITKLCMIDGVSWVIDVGGSAQATFTLASLDTRNFFILGDSSLGVLGTSKLDY
jgi:hypothetical protein